MKQFYTVLILLSASLFAQAQIVTIPDANFKAALLDNFPVIDTNGDDDIQISEAAALTYLNIENEDIVDLTGIEAFINVTTLQVRNNDITDLDLSNNTNIIDLDCSNNLLASLTLGANSNLNELLCNNNLLTILDLSAAVSLQELSAHFNVLTDLDVSNSPNLIDVTAYNNALTTINLNGAASLQSISLSANQLSYLDVSNNTNLQFVNCSQNQLASINLNGLNVLATLEVNDNLLQNIDISSNVNLQNLDGELNQLSALDISNNIYLETLTINENLFTNIDVILNNTSSITTLYAQNNQIENVDLSANTSLTRLYLNDNQLTGFTGNNTIQRIDCTNNQFTTFDLSENYESLVRIVLSNNLNLNYINLKNGKNENYLYINVIGAYDGLDNLQAVCVDDTDSDFASWIQAQNNHSIVFTEYCSFTPGGTYYTVNGNTLFDVNANGCDATDLVFPNFKLNITNGTIVDSFFSNELGEYEMPIQAGNYTITPQLENSDYFLMGPNSVSIDFPNDASPYTQDFCMTANGVHDDLEITIVPLEGARPGFDADYKLIYNNKGNTTLSGNIDFVFNDDYVDFLSAIPNVNSQTTGNLTWNYSNLLPFETREIDFTFSLNPPTDENFPLNSDDILEYSATIFPLANDETADDNAINLNQVVVNSYDPNDKTCLEGPTVTSEQIGAYVHYLIRFENTGTANAINIVVKDVIDLSKYELSTLIPLQASHSFVTRIQNENEVEFIFENIQLPFDDANNDGYVVFKIKTRPSLVLGDTFSNQAEIYFDFNFPIITNTETTLVQDVLSVEEFAINSIQLSPNPTDGFFTLNHNTHETIEKIELYDISGKRLKQFQQSVQYDITYLESGVYFLKFSVKNRTHIKTLIKI